MEDCKPAVTPLDPTIYSTASDSQGGKTPTQFRELIGALMYLAVSTRFDISFAVSFLSRFLAEPTSQHWNFALRVLRYLKGTANLGIVYHGSTRSEAVLEAFSDSDYASDPVTRRSVSGQVFKYNGSPVSWSSTQQKTVALSSTEAEYLAACEATKTALWLKQLLVELHLEVTPTILIDNQSAIRLIKNPEFHKRTKHIDVRYHFIREKFDNREIDLGYVPSEVQEADLFTKPLKKPVFLRLRDLINGK